MPSEYTTYFILIHKCSYKNHQLVLSMSNFHQERKEYTALHLISGIISPRYIAGVTREGRFAAQLITSNTQLVFMDEWTADSLSAEDAKRVLQGKFVT